NRIKGSQPAAAPTVELACHKDCIRIGDSFNTGNQGNGRPNAQQNRRHGLFAPRTLCGKRRHTLQFETAGEFFAGKPNHFQDGAFPVMSNPAQVPPKFPDSIFRAYDIRGTVPEFLNAETAYWLG